ncbi:MAG: YjbQ family protein [Nanoarchaeota archaeon]|nr:YjbQ family protein [Nanoarchaeota archaeon]
MDLKDEIIKLILKEEFTPIQSYLEKIIEENQLVNANLVCWVPHEVASIVQIGWEDGLLDDIKEFLNDTAPKDIWKNHDEPGTPFRYNFHQHIRTKLVGNVSITLIVKDGKLFIGKYQDLYFYSPVFNHIPEQMIFCRIMKFD